MATEIQGGTDGQGVGGVLGNLNVEEAQQIMEQTRAAVDQALETAAEFIREKPIVCLAGALALGYVIGKIASR